jgi:hypothetical protein
MTLIQKLKIVYGIIINHPADIQPYRRISELMGLLESAKLANDDLLSQTTRLNNLVGIEKQELQKELNLFKTQYIRNNVWNNNDH